MAEHHARLQHRPGLRLEPLGLGSRSVARLAAANGGGLPRAGNAMSQPTPMSPEDLRAAIQAKLLYAVGKDPARATRHDWFRALAFVVRDRLVEGWMATTRRTYGERRKRVYYLSLEFLIGRLLADALRNLGLMETA